MSYRIVFRGGIEDMFVDDTRGTSLSYAWEQSSLPQVINIDGALLETKLIKAIIPGVKNPDSSREKESNMLYMEEMNRDFYNSRSAKLALAAKERAQNTKLAEVFFYGVCGRNMTEQERNDVILAQEEFFESNPNWAEANPTCYKHIIDRVPKEHVHASVPHSKDIMRSLILSFTQKQVANSIQK